jgi:hypothetical protein
MLFFSCYFSGNDTVTPSTIEKPVFDLQLRKVVQYTYSPISGDTSDVDSGHGMDFIILSLLQFIIIVNLVTIALMYLIRYSRLWNNSRTCDNTSTIREKFIVEGHF